MNSEPFFQLFLKNESSKSQSEGNIEENSPDPAHGACSPEVEAKMEFLDQKGNEANTDVLNSNHSSLNKSIEAKFLSELETFFKYRGEELRAPKFYGEEVDLFK